ncbi:MAG: hypothetical protein EA403_16705 [Spirochaetaceae bacterium]|nr:MAG: hypothetical protein EA403_16705 [Spirochaetaceae bacterium]
MRVLIDDHPLDVTLEQEKTLSEVLAGVNEFLSANGMILTALSVDNDELELDALSEWGSRSISGVQEIRLITQPQWELVLTHLHLVGGFIHAWREALVSNESPTVAQLAQDQSDLARHLEEHVGLIFTDLPDGAFTNLFSVTGDPKLMADPPTGRNALLTEMDQLIPLIEQRIAEIQTPERVVAAVAGLVTSLIPQVQEVSILLQTGKDTDAMSLVVRFTELTEKLFRTLPHLARVNEGFRERFLDGERLPALTADLNERLHELVDAFGAQDSVLIGDLLEYEIVPRIEELIAVLPADNGA